VREKKGEGVYQKKLMRNHSRGRREKKTALTEGVLFVTGTRLVQVGGGPIEGRESESASDTRGGGKRAISFGVAHRSYSTLSPEKEDGRTFCLLTEGLRELN